MKTTIYNLYHIFLISCLSICGISIGCSSSQDKHAYKFNNSYTIVNKMHKPSNSKIDTYTTYEIYFTLTQPVPCISIDIETSYIIETFTRKKRLSKTFFIVEKIVDLAHFHDKNKQYMFSEIGRNFDYDWKKVKEMKICSALQDPIKRLDNISVYRIRYTTFTDYEYGFDSLILIKANCPVNYHNSIPKKQKP